MKKITHRRAGNLSVRRFPAYRVGLGQTALYRLSEDQPPLLAYSTEIHNSHPVALAV
jgi:hypothetical protein